MKNPKEMRERAERYRGHAKAVADPSISDVIRSVADNLEHQAEELERHDSGKGDPDKERS